VISCKAVFQIGATANRTISARMSFMRALNTMTFHLSNRSCDVIQIANITIQVFFPLPPSFWVILIFLVPDPVTKS
jgi:hypothetical protein